MKYKEKKIKDEDLFTRRFITLLIILFFSLFLLLYIILPAKNFDLITEGFNRLAVGISALLTVIFGVPYVSEEIAKKKRIRYYLQKYPHNQFTKDWDLIESESYPGAVYLFDIKEQKKHHILNMKTVYDLGWHIYWQKIKKIKDDDFQKIDIGERIRTQGEAGE